METWAAAVNVYNFRPAETCHSCKHLTDNGYSGVEKMYKCQKFDVAMSDNTVSVHTCDAHLTS